MPNATIYMRETAHGIMVDNAGEFQTTLKQGSYTCDVSSLGYERKTQVVEIDRAEVSLTVVLEEKVYQIKAIEVSARREDPAYAVMRKAITMAPYYLYQMETYEADVYMKGTVKVEKLPRIIKAQIKDKELKDIVGKLILVESQSLIKYQAPNNYDETILAFSQSIPFDDSDISNPMDIMTTNIYDPNMWGRISPLSPGAFTYYKFALEGVAVEGERLVNKIRVIPKKKNAKLVSGWLYIMEDSWNVQSADLTGTEMGVTIRFTANYNEVVSHAFLPTAYDIQMKVNLMGIKANAKFNASIQYVQTTLNTAQAPLRATETPQQPAVPEKQQTKKQQQAQKKLEVLAEKETLSNRDAYKMSKLMREMTEPEEVRERRESLEIKPLNANIKVKVDSMAKRRDSLYWADVRDLPLRVEEIESYQQMDTAKATTNEEGQNTLTISAEVGGGSGLLGHILLGSRIKFGKQWWLSYSGLRGVVSEYNFVDGFWLGQRVTLGADFGKEKTLRISPSAYYTTAREAVNWQVDATFAYAPIRNGQLTFSAGNTTADFNRHTGTMRLINSLSSLLFARNPIMFYQKRFVEASHRIDVANGLTLTAGFVYEDRNSLSNRQSYSFWGGNPAPNLLTPDHTATKANVMVSYTPRYRYRLNRNGQKRYVESAFPTFSLFYEKGIPGKAVSSASFDRLDLGIDQKIKLNMFDHLQYFVNAGKFLSRKQLYFPDFKHFSTGELFLTTHFFENSFSLLDNYAYSTNDQWLQAHVNYTSQYLLIKHLPFLQNYMFNEALHARTLWLPGRNHSEVGYSLGIEELARIGVFVGFENGKYDAVGFSVSLPLLRVLGR